MAELGPSGFGWGSTTDEVLAGIDLSGKVALVTGASSGLGVETARALASVGAEVTLTARDMPKVDAVAEAIRERHPQARISTGELELTRPESVRAFAKSFLSGHERLDLLVNNAGLMASPLMRTAEGWEMQLATCHLGHFLLTGLLADALLKGAPSRIVNLSSGGHRFSDLDFDDPFFDRREYDKWIAYGQAKTANVLFTVALEKRLAARGVHAYAVHPGVIMTELARHMTEDDIKELMARAPRGEGMKFKPVEAGAATTVWAATSPSLEGRGGLYLEDCNEGLVNDTEGTEGGYAPYAVDPETAEQLWSWSEGILGERFDP